jgi:hypothetical protein
MMRSLLLLVAGAALMSGCATTGANQQVASVGDSGVKKECRSIVATGSIMPKRYCMTSAQWQQIDEGNAASAKQGLDQMNRSGQSTRDGRALSQLAPHAGEAAALPG